MTDIIEIKQLLLRTIVGINPEERVNRQDVLVSVRLTTDTQQAGESDDIADAVNYRSICKEIIELVEQSEFFLVEKLAAAIAQLCLRNDRIDQVFVKVEKPGALRFAASVGVEISRTRLDDCSDRSG